MPTHLLHDIQWDTDGHDIYLPERILVDTHHVADREELEENMSNMLSDRTGFCHKGFKISLDVDPATEPWATRMTI